MDEYAIPKSIARVKGNQLTYVKTGTSSLDHYGADWASPTALSFQTNVTNATRMRTHVSLSTDRGYHPREIIDAMEDMFTNARDLLERERCVAAKESRDEIIFDYHVMGRLRLTLELKVWSKIPGVTVYKTDTTI